MTPERIILETQTMMGLRKSFEDLRYSDVESIILKKNILSSELVIRSRFQGEIHCKALGKSQTQEMDRRRVRKSDG